MQFASIDYQMRICREHLDATGTWGTEVESFLVQYLLVRICAEWELRIPILFERRCARTPDVHLKQFAQLSAQYFSKRFTISELGKALGRFGDDYKLAFAGLVINQAANTGWDNIYTNRHSVAHYSPLQMTFSDLVNAYNNALGVLDGIVVALGLAANEVNDLV